MILCIFPWPLRCHLALPSDSAAGFYVHTPRGDAIVRPRTVHGAEVLSFKGEKLAWLSEEYAGCIAQLDYHYESGIRKPVRYTYFRTDDPFVDAVVYPGLYTQLEIAFETTGTDVLDDQSQFDDLAHWIESIVQNFVSVYAAITQEEDIVTPHLSDLDQTTVFFAEKYEFTPQFAAAEFHMHSPRSHLPQRASLRSQKSPLSGERLDEFASLLRKGYCLPLSGQLLLQAKEIAHISQQYDLSIILAATAFEVFIREVLVETCTRKGIKTLIRKGDRESVSRPYKEAIERGEVRDDLLGYVEQIGGKNYKGSSIYENWYNEAYNVRNAIIHRAKAGHNTSDAEKAFNATSAYIDAVRKSLV